jgi:protein TonB
VHGVAPRIAPRDGGAISVALVAPPRATGPVAIAASPQRPVSAAGGSAAVPTHAGGVQAVPRRPRMEMRQAPSAHAPRPVRGRQHATTSPPSVVSPRQLAPVEIVRGGGSTEPQLPDPSAVTAEAVGGQWTDTPIPAARAPHPPRVVSRVSPEYPRQARLRGIEGLVLLEAVLDRRGAVERGIRVVESVPLLDQAAIGALRRWRFDPARDELLRPIRAVLRVPVRFVLR